MRYFTEISGDDYHYLSYFHQTMKLKTTVAGINAQASMSLKALLDQVPAVKLGDVEFSSPGEGLVDLVAHVEAAGTSHVLACEVRPSGQPRHVLMAPYLSPEAQALCREQEVGYLDLHGNAHLAFDGVFIERQVAGKPPVERRALRSLFKPKSARVLRALLRDPARAWRVVDLAEDAGVSLGHVSNVRTALLGRGWAETSTGKGLHLSAPDSLLDAWRDGYERPESQRMAFYTTLHGRGLEDAERGVLRAGPSSGCAVLASFSAAQWLAPYGRSSTQYFYADGEGLQRLKGALKLSDAGRGENVVVLVPSDEGVLRDTVEPAPGVVCTSPVQTFLDLAAAGERGREAADHLRRERLRTTEPRLP
jgi:hypothetical protein